MNHIKRKGHRAKVTMSAGIMALEPRIMFDGAAMADAAHAAADAAAKALIPAVTSPTVVRDVDPAKNDGKKEVVFVDTSVTAYKTLETAVKDGVEIVEIDGSISGLAQMAAWAESRVGYDSMSILSHGGQAQFAVGTDVVNEVNLADAMVQAELAQIGHALKAGGELDLYGCDIAAGTAGQRFISVLATYTGANVAASVNDTGANGDWMLEAATGAISSSFALDTNILASSYGGDLGFPAMLGLGASGKTEINSIAIDSAGNRYVTGIIQGEVNLNPAGVETLAYTPNTLDILVEKFNSDGTLAWRQVFGGGSQDAGVGIAVDNAGGVYVTGTYTGTVAVGAASLVGASSSYMGANSFVEKLDAATGAVQWINNLPGKSSSVFVKSAGIAYSSATGKISVVGSISGTVDMDSGPGTTNLTSAGSSDAFAISLSSNGTLAWAKRFGGAGADLATAVAHDSSGNLLITGTYVGTSVNLDPSGTTNIAGQVGIPSTFIEKINADGSFGFAKGITDTQKGIVARAISVDSSNNIYVGGVVTVPTTVLSNVDFDPGAGVSTASVSSNSVGYVVKLNSAGNYQWKQVFTAASDVLALATDSSNNLYIGGAYTQALNVNPNGTAFNLSLTTSSTAGASDGFVEKVNSSGAFVWAKSIGSIAEDKINAIATDSSGNVYSAGYFKDTIALNPNTPASLSYVYAASSSNSFIQELSSTGTYVWSMVPDAGGTVTPKAIKKDAAGNLYVVGNFTGIADFDPGPGVSRLTAPYAKQQAFVQKLNADGTLAWAIPIMETTGAGSITCYAMDIDDSGNIYVGGAFAGTAKFDPSSSAANLTSDGLNDGFVAKYDNSGSLIFAKKFGGISADLVSGIDCVNGNAYLSGSFSSNAMFGSVSLTSTGSNDAFVAKLNASNGNVTWARRFGGTGTDQGQAIAADALGNIYASGYYGGTATFGSANLISAGPTDGFVIKINDSDGSTIWVKGIGGVGQDNLPGIAIGGSGKAYVTGSVGSSYYVNSVLVPATGSAGDIAIVSFNTDGTTNWAKCFGGSGADTPTTIALDPSGSVYVGGSFASTVNFGAITNGSATAQGTANAFVVQLDGSTGATTGLNAWGGLGYDIVYGVAAGANQTAYAVGYVTGGPTTFPGGTNVAYNGTTAFVTSMNFIASTNHAPVLDATKSPALTNESRTDSAVPSGAVGTLVSDLIGTGGITNFTDADGDSAGIALVGTDTSTASGSSWFYTTDGGATWANVSTVSASSALLLKADANTRLYFVNNGTYSGSIASAITFRAWDRTTGSAGTKVDTSTNGSTSAFSTATDTASLTITPVNTAPTFSGASAATTTLTVTAGSTNNSLNSLLTISDTDLGQSETWRQYSAPAHGSISLAAGDLTAASGGASLTPGSTITYTPNTGYAGTDTFTVSVSDGQSTVNKTITVTVTPVAPGTPTLETDTGVSGDSKTNAVTINFGGSGAAYGTGATDGSDVIVFLDVNGNGSYDAGTDKQAIVTANTSGVWTGAAINATGVADGAYNVYAQTRSTIGSVTGPLSAARSITIDRTAPLLSSTTPADNSASVSGATTTLGVTFNSTVRVGTGNFILHDITTNSDVATIAATSGSITGWGTNSLTVTHGATLEGGHHYSLRIASTAVQDDAGNAYAGIANDVAVDFTVINTTPTYANATTAVTVAQNATNTDISAYLVASDTDVNQTETWTVQTAPSSGGTVTLTTASMASGGATLTPSIFYRPNAGYYGTETFTIRVSDGVSFTDKSFTVTVDAKPVVTATSAAGAYTEQAAAGAVDPGITITDADNSGNGNWNGGSLKVQITANADSHDALALPTVNGGGIWNNGGTIQNNLTAIGTLSSAAYVSAGAGNALTITFNGSATSADVQALARAVTFADTFTDPASGTRTVTFTATDGSGAIYNSSTTRNIAFTLKNDAPTVSATATGSTFTEKGTAATLFSSAAISAVEAGQSIQKVTLTVGAIADGSNEILVVDGSDVALTNGNVVTTTGGGGYSVSVAVDGGGVATLTITKSGNFTAAAAQTLVTGLTYKNTSTDPNTTDRTVTLTSVEDNGGGAAGDYTRSVTIADTVHVAALNDAPTLFSSGKSPSFNTTSGTAVTVFGSTAVSAVEAGQSISQLQMTVSNVANGGSEKLVIDGTDVALSNGNSVTTGSGYQVSVAVNGSSLATLTITKAGNMLPANAQTLVDGIQYKNVAGGGTTAGNRVATLTSATDNGANGGGSVNSTTLSGISSTITVVVTPPDNFAGHITLPGAQALHASAQTAISGLSITDTTAEVVTAIVRTDQNAGLSGQLNFTTSGVAQLTGNNSANVSITGTLTDVNNTLASLKYTAPANTTGTEKVTVTFNDGATTFNGGAMAADNSGGTFDIVLTGNATPTVAATVGYANFADTDNTPHAINGLQFADSDIDTTGRVTLAASHGTLTLTGTTGLTLVSGANGSSSMAYSGSLADINAALLGLGYRGAQYYVGTDTISATFDDRQTGWINGNKTASQSITATISHTDVAPTVTVPAGPQSIADNQPHALSVSIADADAAASNAVVTVEIAAGSPGDGNRGSLHITTGGVTLTNGTANDSNTIRFTGTAAQISAALAGLTYTTAKTGDATETISVTVIGDDNPNGYSGVASNTSGTITVNVHGNDTPVLAGSTAGTVTDRVAHTITSFGTALSLSDSYNGGTVSATVSDTSGLLTIDTSNVTVSGGANGSTSVTFTGSVANVSAALASLTYTDTYNGATNSSDTITVSVDDQFTNGITVGGPHNRSANHTVAVTLQANDTPALSVSGVAAQSYSDTSQHAISGVTLSDSRNGTVVATVTAQNGNLNFTASDGDSNGATNVTIGTNDTNTVTLSGTTGDVNATLATLKYSSTAAASGSDTVAISVNDGGGSLIGGALSDSKSFNITLTANATPSLTVTSSTASYSDNAWHTIAAGSITAPVMTDTSIGTSVTATVSDLHGRLRMTAVGTGAIDSGNSSNNVQIHASSVTDLNATLATLEYSTDAADTGVETVTVTVNDGRTSGIGGAKSATSSFQVALVGNDTPVVTAPAASVVIGDNQTYTISGFSFTDTYSGNSVTATVSGPNAILHLTASGSAVISDNDSGFVTITGSKANVFSTIGSFTYKSATEILADTVTVTVSDGNSAGVGGAKSGYASVTIATAPNDVPDLTMPGGAVVTNDGVKSLSGPTFTDIYSGAPAKATISVTAGTISVAPGNGTTVTNNGTNEVTVTGTVAQINATIRSLAYSYGTVGVAGSSVVSITIDDQNVSGVGGNQTVTKTFSVTLTAPAVVVAPTAPRAEAPKEAPKPPPPALPDTGLKTVVRDNPGSGDKGGGFGTPQGPAFTPAPVAQPQVTTPTGNDAPVGSPQQAVPTGPGGATGAAVAAPTQAQAAQAVNTPVTPVTVIPAALTAPSATAFQVAVAAKPVGGADALVVNTPVKDVGFALGSRISVQIPADSFASTKADATVTLTATRADGAALPSWMVFNPRTGTFEGTPPAGFKGEVVVKVIARDNEGREAVQSFKIQVGEAGQGNVTPQGEGRSQDERPDQGRTGDAEPAHGGNKQAAVKPVGKIGLAQQMKAMSFEGRIAKQMALFNAVKHGGKAA